jgi:hypothetical protein
LAKDRATSPPAPEAQSYSKRIGNTSFIINIYFSGTESAEDKMARLIKNAADKRA